MANNFPFIPVYNDRDRTIPLNYTNTGNRNDRAPGHMVVLDTETVDSDGKFTANLIGNLNIDKIADVYLEYISITKTDAAGSSNFNADINFLAINIDELPTKIFTNNSKFLDKYILINEDYSTNAEDGTVDTFTLKPKSGYFTTVNPSKFSKFTVKITQFDHSNTETALALQANGGIRIGLFFKYR